MDGSSGTVRTSTPDRLARASMATVVAEDEQRACFRVGPAGDQGHRLCSAPESAPEWVVYTIRVTGGPRPPAPRSVRPPGPRSSPAPPATRPAPGCGQVGLVENAQHRLGERMGVLGVHQQSVGTVMHELGVPPRLVATKRSAGPPGLQGRRCRRPRGGSGRRRPRRCAIRRATSSESSRPANVTLSASPRRPTSRSRSARAEPSPPMTSLARPARPASSNARTSRSMPFMCSRRPTASTTGGSSRGTSQASSRGRRRCPSPLLRVDRSWPAGRPGRSRSTR